MQKKSRFVATGRKKKNFPAGLGNASNVGHPPARAGAWLRFKRYLAEPVNGASLAILRVAFGLVMALEAYSLCRPLATTMGKIPLEWYYTGPDVRFNFPYHGFEWLPLLPSRWIYALVGFQALAGVMMALGFFYRAAAVMVFLTWGYLFAVESTRTYWQSYYYLEFLFAFLMIWLPAARRFSVDAWLARRRPSSRTVPRWTLVLLRGQLLIAYFYGGVAKLNLDWLLDAAPVRWDLAEAHVTAAFAPYLKAAQLQVAREILHSAWCAYFISYAGVIFDLSIGVLLLIRRTRILGMLLMVGFHATNHFIIFDNIDWFPLLGVTTALIFLDSDWPERFWNWLRRPRLAKPDWSWFAAGAVLLPVVGASLGWKLKASSAPAQASLPGRLGRVTAAFVLGWLAWQVLMPLRHYLIPGDGRFTYEGLSFSWRLKADDHRALGVQMVVKDPKIISREEAGPPRIKWSEWRGDRVIYRSVTPGRIPWAALPEIVILLEPISGERMLYNPFAGTAGVRTEAEGRERVRRLWQELYGQPPQSIIRTGPLVQTLGAVTAALRAGDENEEAARLAGIISRLPPPGQNEISPPNKLKVHQELRAMLGELHRRDETGAMTPFLRRLDPFALAGEPSGLAPFLLIEDARLCRESPEKFFQIERQVWKHGPAARAPGSVAEVSVGGEPIVIYTHDVGVQARDMLPLACIFDDQDQPGRPPYIWWNCPRDLSSSKFIHISNQPFYLRRYARRVAAVWEAQYARRPIVNAVTAVSLNGRPYQELVDPTADLARVPVTWFGHNPWIRDLEMARIPRTALTERRE